MSMVSLLGKDTICLRRFNRYGLLIWFVCSIYVKVCKVFLSVAMLIVCPVRCFLCLLVASGYGFANQFYLLCIEEWDLMPE